MHVAMVLRQFSPHGGLELYALQVIKGLLAKDIRVTVICESDDTGLSHPNLTVKYFAKPPKGMSKADKITYYYDAASKAVSEYGPFDLVHSQHFPVSPVDVVTLHNHTVFRLSEVGQSWERLLNNSKIKFSRAYQLRRDFDEKICHQARCLIVPAKVMADDFKKHYQCQDKTFITAHPGARLAADDAILRTENSEQEFCFLFVGKGFRKKGLDILHQACALLKKRKPNFKLLVAGLKEKPVDTLRLSLLGLRGTVNYLGFQKDMDAVYKRASVTILPSRVEPFGMAPIQGMLRGLVPIVSTVSGVAEVLTDKQDALILQDHLSAEDLSRHMELLMSDSNLLQSMSQRSLNTAQKLTWDATTNSTIEAYTAALAPQNTR